MGKKVNLIGQKYNRLTVIEETAERDSSGCIIWLCRCDCGNFTKAASAPLRSGHKKSCGCLNLEQASNQGKKNLIDLTSQRFGRLVVLERVPNKTDNSRRVYWKCQCDCGNTYIGSGHALKSGQLMSCGCMKSKGEEKIALILSKNNIPYEKEKIFSNFNPYRFDFYVDNKYIIEYDGKQHFEDYSWGSSFYTKEEVLRRDNLKNKYCFDNNIPIIRIPYTHYDKISLEDLQIDTSLFKLSEEKLNDYNK